MKEPLYVFNRKTLEYDKCPYLYFYVNGLNVIGFIILLVIVFSFGGLITTNCTKQSNTIKIIHSDSLSVIYPIEYVNTDSIKGNTKVANDLRYYYNQILKRK